MSLLDTAAADLRAILSDSSTGFAAPITVTSPAGVSVVINGFQNDVALTIDPETGLMVAGRRASVTLPMAALAAAGMEQPRAISDKTKKPWLMAFTAPSGREVLLAVSQALPDELGCIVCLLETYKP